MNVVSRSTLQGGLVGNRPPAVYMAGDVADVGRSMTMAFSDKSLVSQMLVLLLGPDSEPTFRGPVMEMIQRDFPRVFSQIMENPAVLHAKEVVLYVRSPVNQTKELRIRWQLSIMRHENGSSKVSVVLHRPRGYPVGHLDLSTRPWNSVQVAPTPSVSLANIVKIPLHAGVVRDHSDPICCFLSDMFEQSGVAEKGGGAQFVGSLYTAWDEKPRRFRGGYPPDIVAEPGNTFSVAAASNASVFFCNSFWSEKIFWTTCRHNRKCSPDGGARGFSSVVSCHRVESNWGEDSTSAHELGVVSSSRNVVEDPVTTGSLYGIGAIAT